MRRSENARAFFLSDVLFLAALDDSSVSFPSRPERRRKSLLGHVALARATALAENGGIIPMIEVYLVPNAPVEYFCSVCKQLRLSLRGRVPECGNCGAEQSNLIFGKPGTLDKEALRKAN